MRTSLLLPIILVIVLSTSSCSEESTLSSGDTLSNEPDSDISAEDVRTYPELLSYLEQRYGQVEELQVAALIEYGRDTHVPFRYRLEDGSEFTVPIILTSSNERIVDPEFDLRSLPD